jgi:aminoglycoside phosphotransferase (APT) family kinase protein
MKQSDTSIFEYSKDIDKKLPSVVEGILGVKVIGVERIEQGIMNYSFKVETEDTLLLARVFGKKDVVDINTLLWINTKLEENNISYPKILGYSMTDEFFPYGYMVLEYISGKEGSQAIVDMDISLPDYFYTLGVLMKKIHAIPVDTYGEIAETDIGYSDYAEHTMSKVDSLIAECVDAGHITTELSESIKENIKTILLKYESRFHPVLVHGDCGPSNQILSKKNDLFMIDWDYARKGVWFEDLVPIVLSAENFSNTEQRENVVSEIRTSFLKGYGQTEFLEKEILEIEKVFTVITFLYNLSFYSGDQRNVDMVATAKEKIHDLIYS